MDCQLARRDLEDLLNYRKLATSSGFHRRRNWHKWERRTVAINTSALLSREVRQKCLDVGNRLMSLTNYLASGVGTCTQSGMTIPSCLSLEMHLGKLPDHTELQSRIVSFRKEVCPKGKNPTLALQWIMEVEEGTHHSEINYAQRFPRLWKVGFDDGRSTEAVLRCVHALPKEVRCRRAESSERQPISPREGKLLIWSTNIFVRVQFHTGERRHPGHWFTLGAITFVQKRSSIGQCFRRNLCHQASTLFPDSANYGTIQSRNSERRWQKKLSQTENVCEIKFWASSKVQISRFGTKLQSVAPWLKKERVQILSPNGKQEDAFRVMQIGFVQEESFIFRHMHAPCHNTQKSWEHKRSSPRPAVGGRKHGRKDKEQASSGGPKVREQTIEKSRGSSCD